MTKRSVVNEKTLEDALVHMIITDKYFILRLEFHLQKEEKSNQRQPNELRVVVSNPGSGSRILALPNKIRPVPK